MAADNEDEFQSLWDRFLSTCTIKSVDDKGQPIILIKNALAYDGISYIMRQLSPEARLCDLNEIEYRVLLERALEDWFVLVYINHYDTDALTGMQEGIESVINKDPFFTSGYNLIAMLFNRAKGGGDRRMKIEKIKAANPAANLVMAPR